MSTKVDVWIKDAKAHFSKPGIDICICHSEFLNGEVLQAFRERCSNERLCVFVADSDCEAPFPKSVLLVTVSALDTKQFATEITHTDVDSFLETIEKHIAGIGVRQRAYLTVRSPSMKLMHSCAIAAKKKFRGNVAFETFPKTNGETGAIQWRVVLLADKLLDAAKRTTTTMVDSK